MSPVAVSADRRFHRAHVKPTRRRAVWRTVLVSTVKYGIVLGVLLFGAVKVRAFVSTSPTLRIESIEPSGNQRVPAEAVRTMLEGLRGENILFADLEGWRSRLLESPWIREVSFRRSLPSSIQVVVQERLPIAIARRGSRLLLVDERGVAIDEYGPAYSALDLPIVDGFSGERENAAEDETRGALAARLVMALRQKPVVAGRLSQVDVSDVHNVTILLNDDPAELRVGDDHFLERVESYLSLSDALHARVPEIDYVDLRFDGRVYVRPLGTPGRPAAGRSAVRRVTDAAQQ